MCSDAPDTSGVNAAAVASSKLGADQFAWFTKEYERTAPERAAVVARDNAVADAQIKGMSFATDEAKAFSDRNKTVFQPLEDKIVADAQTYDTPQRRAQMAAEAGADVTASFDRASQGATRALMRTGASPTGAVNAALVQDAALAKAKAVAGATTTATRNVEQQGYARMQDAAALGKGIVGNQGTQQQIATQSGGAAVGAGAASLGANQTGANLMQTGFQGAMQGQGQAGQLFGQAAQIEASAKPDVLGGLGGLGMAAGAMGWKPFSDENMKKGTGKKADGERALAEVMATPVEEGWQYDESKGAPAGLGGENHIGPMAQKVRATMGESAAPGGKRLDLVNINGRLMAAMQALAKKVERLEKELA